MKCYFCESNNRPFFDYFCEDCSMLRRILLVYSPKKAIEILKATTLRNGEQIAFKISQQIEKIEESVEEIEKNTEKTKSKSLGDETYIKPKTRAKKI